MCFGELACLQQREHFPKLVHCAEAARKNDEGFGNLREPKFAHEEIMKIEAELGTDVGVGELLVGQFDRKADGFAAGFDGAAIGGFHNARAAAGANDEAARPGSESERPGSNFVGEFAALPRNSETFRGDSWRGALRRGVWFASLRKAF